MKNTFSKHAHLLALVLLWGVSSSFGLLEPSTVLRHKAPYQQVQQDSSAVESSKLVVEEKNKKNNTPSNDNEKENSGTNALADSLIQWIASSMKMLVSKVLSLVFHNNNQL